MAAIYKSLYKWQQWNTIPDGGLRYPLYLFLNILIRNYDGKGI